MDVLVVDDDPDTRDLLVRALARAGLSVRSAPNGRDALAAVVAELPAAVVLDARMPGMDGVGFLGVIRSYLRWARLPVVMVTAYPDSPDVDAARRLGVRRVFTKDGIDLEALATCVAALARDPDADCG